MLVWFFYFGAMFAFFLSPLINYAMEHMVLMDAFNVGFLLGGCLYWWPIVGLDPIVHWRMGYGTRLAALSLGVPFEAFLGVAIMTLRTPIASMYSLNSTHSGGALLWAATELATFIGLIPVFVMWMRADERAGGPGGRQSRPRGESEGAGRTAGGRAGFSRQRASYGFELRHGGAVPALVPAGQQQLGGHVAGQSRLRTVVCRPDQPSSAWSGWQRQKRRLCGPQTGPGPALLRPCLPRTVR